MVAGIFVLERELEIPTFTTDRNPFRFRPSRKERSLQRSLSILLSVYNAESTLSNTVADVLDTAADLSERFELVIIDDGSVDATSEVVDELIYSYPQIKAVRHGKHLGQEAAIRTGLEHSSGEIVLLHDAAHSKAKPRYQLFRRRVLERIHGSSRPTRPNFMERMKDIAAGK